jgi:ABC-2 type transport system permease protein
LKHFVTLTRNRIALTMRNRVFLFFTLLMPMGMFFLFASVFGKGEPLMVAYLLGPVIALTVMGSFWGLSASLVMYREQGILRRFRLAPLTAADMLASSLAANFILTIPTVVLEVLLARWVYHVTQFGNPLSIIILVSVATISFAALGLIVASVTNSMQETQIICQIVWFALLFFSGATFPLATLPKFVQGLAVFLPATYLVAGLQKAMLLAQNPWMLKTEIFVLAAWSILAFFISTQLFRWEPGEKVTRNAKLWALATVLPFLILGAWEIKYGNVQTQSRSIYRMATAAGEPAPANAPEPAARPVPSRQAPR